MGSLGEDHLKQPPVDRHQERLQIVLVQRPRVQAQVQVQALALGLLQVPFIIFLQRS